MSEGGVQQRKLKIKEADEAKVRELLALKRCESATSATFVTLDDEADIEMARAWGDKVCDEYENRNPPDTEEYDLTSGMGFLAATQRYNDDLDCSVACTKEALTLARRALDKADVEACYAQVPGYCHVLARKGQTCKGEPLPWWSCLPTPASKEVAPVVFVALTDGVKVHYIPHSTEVAENFFKVFGVPCADSDVPVHGPNTRFALTGATERESRLLNVGDVFVTHSGMPYYFEPAEPGRVFAVQCVPTVKLSPGNRQYQKWNEVLGARGIYKRGKFGGEHMLHACITQRATEPIAEPTFAGVATKEEVPWLTKGGGAGASSAKKPSASPSGPRPEVVAAMARHDALLDRIEKLDADGWNNKLEKSSKDRRDTLQPQAQMKDVNAYTKCLDTLEKNLKEAEEKRNIVVELRDMLNDCEQRVNAIELPAEAKNEIRMRESRLKTLSEIRAKGGALYDQEKAIRALADQVSNLENACRARLDALATKKKPKSPSTGSGTAKAAPVVSLQPLPDTLDNFQSFAASEEALASLIKKWDSVKGEYFTLAASVPELQPYCKLFGTSLYTVKQDAKKSSYTAVNIGPIMFVDEQLAKFRQARLAANAAAGSAAAAATLGGGERLVTNEGFIFDFSHHGSKRKCALDMCGQMRNVFVNGFCTAHTKEDLDEMHLRYQELYDAAGQPDPETGEADKDIYDALNPIDDEIMAKYAADPIKSKAAFIDYIKSLDEALKIMKKPLFKASFTHDDEEREGEEEESSSRSPVEEEAKTRKRGRIVEENLDDFIDDDQEYVGSDDDDDDEGGGSATRTKKNTGSDLAHRILMMMGKANVYLKTDALVQEYVRAQENEEDLEQVEAHLRDLERINIVYAIKQTDPTDGEETYYPYVFDVKAMAQDKAAALNATGAGGLKYSIEQKEF